MAASFMAKPYGDSSGNGLHLHTSLLDAQGDNVFAEAGEPSELLMQAVAGLLETMPDATALFAPHANSYRRFQPGSHAPMTPTWGIDNRTTALRLPLAAPAAMRVEHRVAGADANPYLVLAAILAGMEHGMAQALTPPSETRGSGYDLENSVRALPDDWGAALARFEQSEFIADYLGSQYQSWYSACKRQEREWLRSVVPASEYELYLRTVRGAERVRHQQPAPEQPGPISTDGPMTRGRMPRHTHSPTMPRPQTPRPSALHSTGMQIRKSA